MRRPETCRSGVRRGAALIEMAVAMPLLLLMLLAILEMGSIFFVRHNMVQAAREAARVLAVQEGTLADAETAAMEQLSGLDAIPFELVIVQPNPFDDTDRDVRVTISAPVDEAAFVDPMGLLGNYEISATVVMRKEG